MQSYEWRISQLRFPRFVKNSLPAADKPCLQQREPTALPHRHRTGTCATSRLWLELMLLLLLRLMFSDIPGPPAVPQSSGMHRRQLLSYPN